MFQTNCRRKLFPDSDRIVKFYDWNLSMEISRECYVFWSILELDLQIKNKGSHQKCLYVSSFQWNMIKCPKLLISLIYSNISVSVDLQMRGAHRR